MKNLKNYPELLTLQEVADIVRVSKMTLKRWDQRGTLKAIRINARGDRRYRKDTIIEFLGIQK